MHPDGTELRRLSFANVSEWNPTLMRDGRILWTRSEYQDKGADFGHTLWSIHPDSTHPELVFGNDTPYGYGHGREVPDSNEIVCTIISHGDHQGPIALIDRSRSPYDTGAITNITPDTCPQYQMGRSHQVTGPPHSYTTRTENATQPHSFRSGTAAPGDDGTQTITEQVGCAGRRCCLAARGRSRPKSPASRFGFADRRQATH